jgi:hypothetical protein
MWMVNSAPNVRAKFHSGNIVNANFLHCVFCAPAQQLSLVIPMFFHKKLRFDIIFSLFSTAFFGLLIPDAAGGSAEVGRVARRLFREDRPRLKQQTGYGKGEGADVRPSRR